MNGSDPVNLTRRSFIKGVAASLAAVTVLPFWATQAVTKPKAERMTYQELLRRKRQSAMVDLANKFEDAMWKV